MIRSCFLYKSSPLAALAATGRVGAEASRLEDGQAAARPALRLERGAAAMPQTEAGAPPILWLRLGLSLGPLGGPGVAGLPSRLELWQWARGRSAGGRGIFPAARVRRVAGAPAAQNLPRLESLDRNVWGRAGWGWLLW